MWARAVHARARKSHRGLRRADCGAPTGVRGLPRVLLLRLLGLGMIASMIASMAAMQITPHAPPRERKAARSSSADAPRPVLSRAGRVLGLAHQASMSIVCQRRRDLRDIEMIRFARHDWLSVAIVVEESYASGVSQYTVA